LSRANLKTLALLAFLITTLAGVRAAAAQPQWKAHGLLDLGLVSSIEGRELNRLTIGDSNFDPYRVRLFLDARLSPALEIHLQTLLHEGAWSVRADGAYALWTPWEGRDLSLEAGKIPWPIGTYAPRAYSDRNWLVGTPLLYQYRTALPWARVPADADELVAAAGIAQFNLDEPFLPVIDERWWDTGAAAIGSWAPWEFALGVVQGSPSWPTPGADNTPGSSLLGRLGVVPVAGVRAGVSAADGTWMPDWAKFALPAGRHVRDYHETTLMADLELARGPFEARGEIAHRRWETATTGDLRVLGGYGEARWTHASGTWLAVRGEALRFSDVTTSAGERPWDDPVDRWEGVVGTRVTHEVRAKAGAQRTVRRTPGAEFHHTDLLFASLGIQF
jgi:hypothetical protein